MGRIRCFCLSQAARDVQQLQETTNSPLRANQISAASYMLPHERRPGSGQPTKMMLAIKALVEWQMRDNDEATTVQLHALLLRHSYTMTVQMTHTDTFAAANEDNHRLHCFIQRQIVLRSFYSVMNHSRTVCLFSLNGGGGHTTKKVIWFTFCFVKTE